VIGFHKTSLLFKGAKVQTTLLTISSSTTPHPLMRSRYLLELHRPAHAIPGGEGVLIPTVSPKPTNGQQSTGRQSSAAMADVLAQYADNEADHGLKLAKTANKLQSPQQ
jgi:hypothetical protein